ncbi:MAG: hypothetical protein CVV64_10690 [Candidatus Wallbacteria bacterium HGW-Wallbacteria-1]|jgi:YVTN family beta-propeller protein|uniref:F5/8 type C domain-containing protein n=1 Tax=Candidatus Wallbacteria bacterium HGW-Wallbacteria-1 TaxID=2013854 RepID=A0A2N1PPC3_9BACT|nr:MAG: hypothetical protein CVV64_10690 [Candidatus Wallbacteria bacterium HGW-Wallbacteria-1]
MFASAIFRRKCDFSVSVLIFLMLCLILSVQGSAFCKDYIYVVNKGGNPDITLVDNETMTSAGTFENAGVSGAAGVAFASDGKTAYVACSEGLAILNTSTLTSPTLVQVVSAPLAMNVTGMALSADNRYACIVTSNRGILLVDTVTRNIVTGWFVTLPGGAPPTFVRADHTRSRMCVTSSNGQIYAASNGSTAFNQILPDAAGKDFRALAISSDGSRYFAASTQAGATQSAFSFISPSPPGVDTSIDLSNVGQSSWITILPDNVTTLVSCTGNGTVAILNLDVTMYIGSISGFTDPAAIFWDSASSRALVANSGSNTISLVDPNQAAITGTITVGTSPWAMAASSSTVGSEFLISGLVTDSGSGAVMEVKIAVTGQSDTYTDGDGRFLVMSLSNGTYTVTPSKEGWTFTPSSRSVTLGPSAETVNFTGSAPQYLFSISGKVTKDGAALPGVTVNLSGSRTAVTDASGNYSFSSLGPGSYTLEPVHQDYDFDPVNKSVTLGPGSSGNNFTATARVYNISGSITDYQGQGLQGVTVEAGALGLVKTGPSGAFSYSNVAKGSYTLTYSHDTYVLSPTSTSVTVPPASTSIKVLARSALEQPYGIGGLVLTATGDPFKGVTVTLSGANLKSVTDNDGIFIFPDLPPGTYTLTPSITGYTFTPASDKVTIGPDNIDTIFLASGSVPAEAAVTCNATPFSGYGIEKLTNGTKVFNSEFALKSTGANIEILFSYPSGITVESVTHTNDGQYGAKSVDVLYATPEAPTNFKTLKTFNLTINANTPSDDLLQVGGIRLSKLKLVYQQAYFNDPGWLQLGEIKVTEGSGSTLPTYQQKLTPLSIVCSHTPYPGFGTGKLYDGATVFNGDFAARNDSGAINLFVDLGGIHAISKVKIVSDGEYGASQVLILYSDSVDNQFQPVAEAPDLSLNPGTPNSRELSFTEVQARFVQFYFPSGFGDPVWFQLNELEVYGDPASSGGGTTGGETPVPLTPRGATCNISTWPGYGVDKLYNGTKIFNSEFAAQNNGAGLEMIFDLGSDVTLHEIDHHNDGEFGATGVAVYYSTGSDPATWTSLSSVTNLTVTAGDVNTDVISFSPLVCRFIKFRYTAFAHSQWFQLAEISFIGIASQTVNPGALTVAGGTSTPAAYQNFGVYRIYDGNIGYNDGFAVNNSDQPVEIVLDLGSDRDFNRIEHYNDGEFGAKAIQILAASAADPTTFSMIYSSTSLDVNPGQPNLDTLSFGTANGKLIKLVYSQFNHPSWFQISEIGIYNSTQASSLSVSLSEAESGNVLSSMSSRDRVGEAMVYSAPVPLEIEEMAILSGHSASDSTHNVSAVADEVVEGAGSPAFGTVKLWAHEAISTEKLSLLCLHLSMGGSLVIDRGAKISVPGVMSEHRIETEAAGAEYLSSRQGICILLNVLNDRFKTNVKKRDLPLAEVKELFDSEDDSAGRIVISMSETDHCSGQDGLAPDVNFEWAGALALLDELMGPIGESWRLKLVSLRKYDEKLIDALQYMETDVSISLSAAREAVKAVSDFHGAELSHLNVAAGIDSQKKDTQTLEFQIIALRIFAARLHQWGLIPLGKSGEILPR